MKIEFLTQDSPLYILPFFEEFFRNYDDDFEITHVSCCRPMGNRSRSKLLRELLGLYGPLGFVRLMTRFGLKSLLGMIPRGKDCQRFYTLPQLCAAYGISFHRVGNPNHPHFVEEVASRRPDIIVSVACPYILKERILGLPPLGCVNIHHAPLPRYKGMLPTFWQMYNGERNVGVTVHYMDAKIDEGRALLQSQLGIQPGESMDHLIQRTKRYGAHCMARVLRNIRTDTQETISLDKTNSSYFTFPTVEQMREFRRRGFRAI
jgi:methionyl-tRNA formyltransferase